VDERKTFIRRSVELPPVENPNLRIEGTSGEALVPTRTNERIEERYAEKADSLTWHGHPNAAPEWQAERSGRNRELAMA
jgi:hypothetical protein